MVAGDSSIPQAGYIPTPIICPRTNKKVDGRVSVDKAQKLAKYGPAYRFHELLTLVRETLADPDSILEYTEEDWRGFCYARNCDYRCTNRDRDDRARPPEGQIFLVFVTQALVVIEWGWEPRDLQQRMLPAKRENRLGQIVWCKK